MITNNNNNNDNSKFILYKLHKHISYNIGYGPDGCCDDMNIIKYDYYINDLNLNKLKLLCNELIIINNDIRDLLGYGDYNENQVYDNDVDLYFERYQYFHLHIFNYIDKCI